MRSACKPEMCPRKAPSTFPLCHYLAETLIIFKPSGLINCWFSSGICKLKWTWSLTCHYFLSFFQFRYVGKYACISSLVDLQCCVSFRCIAQWLSYTHLYTTNTEQSSLHLILFYTCCIGKYFLLLFRQIHIYTALYSLLTPLSPKISSCFMRSGIFTSCKIKELH